MARPVLAKVYIEGGKSIAYPTYPGNFLYFRGGCADVIDDRSMPAALRMEGAIVEVEPNWVDWIPQWVSLCPEQTPVKAEIRVSGRPINEPAPIEPMNVVPLRPPNPENIVEKYREVAVLRGEALDLTGGEPLKQELQEDDLGWMDDIVIGESDSPQTVLPEPKRRGRPRKAWDQP